MKRYAENAISGARAEKKILVKRRRTLTRIFFGLSFSLAVLLLSPSSASASVLHQQLDATQQSFNDFCSPGNCAAANTASDTRWPVMYIPSTTWTSIRSWRVIWFPKMTDGTCPTSLYGYIPSTGGAFLSYTADGIVSGQCRFTLTDPGAGPGGTFDYAVAFGSSNLNSNGPAEVRGTNSGSQVTGFANVYSGGAGFDPNDTSSQPAALKDVAYYIGDAADPVPSFVTSVVSASGITSVSPTTSTTPISSPVTFSGTVDIIPSQFGSSTPTLTLNVNNNDNGTNNYPGFIFTFPAATGTYSFSTTSAQTNGYYDINFVLNVLGQYYNSRDNAGYAVTALSQKMIVGTTTLPQQSINDLFEVSKPTVISAFGTCPSFTTDPANSAICFISTGLSQAFSFAFVPTTQSMSQYSNLSVFFRSKFPFAYFFQASDIISGSVNVQATSTPFINWPLSHYIGTSSTSSLPQIITLQDQDMFSSSTITKYLPPVVLNVFRALMSAVMWLLFLLFVFQTTRKHIRPKT